MELTLFEKSILYKIKAIPRGKVSTYAEVARAVGRPGSSRAVGNALNKNPFAPKIPCHRVVKSDACPGGYAGGEEKKIGLLKKEKIEVRNGKILNFNELLYKFV